MITKDSFLNALSNNKVVRPQDIDLLVSWFVLPNRAATADQVMKMTGAKRASLIVNNLGKRIAGFLEVEIETGFSMIALVGTTEENEAAWVMHEELAQALVAHGAKLPEVNSVSSKPVVNDVAEIVEEFTIEKRLTESKTD